MAKKGRQRFYKYPTTLMQDPLQLSHAIHGRQVPSSLWSFGNPVGVLWYNAGSTRCLDNMISFLMHIHYIIENFVKIYKPSCMHPHRYYHSAKVCKSLVMLFILFLTYVFSLYY